MFLLLACSTPDTATPAVDDTDAGYDDPCPIASLSRSEITWTEVPVGSSEVQTLALANACSGEISLEATATLDNPVFSLDAQSWTLLPGDVATISVTYAPDDFNADAGTLSLAGFVITLSGTSLADSDGDGVADDEDCDLTDGTIYPGAAEIWYDGIDQACDGGSDYDRDADGFDSDDWGGTDCDDGNAAVYLGAAETWYDGIDQDCDGNDTDQDLDGYGADDCNDLDATVNPGAAEVWYDDVDQNCDGNDDDQDADGHTDDCNDTDASIHPGAAEIWYDDIDQDCDGNDDDQDGDGFTDTDCNDTDASVFPGAVEVWYDGTDQDCDGNDADQDGDGYGTDDCDDTDVAVNPAAVEVWYDGIDQNCDGNDDDQDGDGYAADDCDDTDVSVNPAASEVWYDGTDQNCDSADDYDQDGDGERVYDLGGDCDDTDASTLEGPEETRNGEDDDCDGLVDEGIVEAGDVVITEVMVNPSAVSDTVGEWFEVENLCAYDVDLYGWLVYADDGSSFEIDASVPLAPGDIVVLGVSDDSRVNGGALVDLAYDRVEFAFADTGDSIYLVNEGDTIAELAWTSDATEGAAMQLDPDHYADPDTEWWCDAQTEFGAGDLGTPGEANDQCEFDEDGDGYTPDEDCDDAEATVYPGALEILDGLDNDCDGTVDDGASDDDGDGLSDAAGDCDDADASVFPGATESCNGTDDDCDGDVDPENADGCTTWAYDYDADGYGSDSVAARCLCSPDGYYNASSTGDCYDYSASASPAATSWYSTNRGDGSYDYDCDTAETKYDTSVGSCSGYVWICSSSAGWNGSVASCGVTADYVTGCDTTWYGSCYADTTSATQSCR